jgi:hypothetical protein
LQSEATSTIAHIILRNQLLIVFASCPIVSVIIASKLQNKKVLNSLPRYIFAEPKLKFLRITVEHNLDAVRLEQ